MRFGEQWELEPERVPAAAALAERVGLDRGAQPERMRDRDDEVEQHCRDEHPAEDPAAEQGQVEQWLAGPCLNKDEGEQEHHAGAQPRRDAGLSHFQYAVLTVLSESPGGDAAGACSGGQEGGHVCRRLIRGRACRGVQNGLVEMDRAGQPRSSMRWRRAAAQALASPAM